MVTTFVLALSLLATLNQVQGDVSKQWEFLDLGDFVGMRGEVVVGDFDNNGYAETYVIANSYKDVMKIQFDGQNYTIESRIPRPQNDTGHDQEIHSLVHLATDTHYGLVTTEDSEYVFVYDLVTMEFVERLDMAQSGYSYFAGIAHLADGFGAAYTIDTQLVVVSGNGDDGFHINIHLGLADYGGIIGSFTGPGLVEIVYSDGSLYQYNEDTDGFLQINGFPYALTSDSSNPIMIKIDIDHDGIDEIVAESGIGLECSSAIGFGIIWTFDVS